MPTLPTGRLAGRKALGTARRRGSSSSSQIWKHSVRGRRQSRSPRVLMMLSLDRRWPTPPSMANAPEQLRSPAHWSRIDAYGLQPRCWRTGCSHVAVSSHCPGGGAAASRACRLCGVRRACRAQVRPGARVIPGALDLRRSPKAMGLGAQGSSAGPQGHGPRQGPWISRARTMAPVGPHDHVANEVRLRGRRTDAHLSPTTVLDPQFVSGIPARQTRQSERGRARTESLCPRFGCLFAVGFTRSVHWSSLLRPACSFVRGRNRRAARPRRSPRVRAPPLPSGSPSGAPCRPVVCARPRGPATVTVGNVRVRPI